MICRAEATMGPMRERNPIRPLRPAIDSETPPRHQPSRLERAVDWLSFPLQMALVLGVAAGQIVRKSQGDASPR